MSLLRLLRLGLLWFCAIGLLYGASAVAGAIIFKPGAALHSPAPDSTEVLTEVLLVAGSIHYDILLPLNPQTREEFRLLTSEGIDLSHPRARWLVIGWGARAFYTATGSISDLKASAVVKGLLGDQSVLRVDLAGQLSSGVDTRKLLLTPTQYRAFMRSIQASFRRNDQGQPIALSIGGLTDTDMFFEAQGRFDLLHTCNNWIGARLRAAGLRFGWWTPTPYAVTLSHWLYQTP